MILKSKINKFISGSRLHLSPEKAYNKWAAVYDSEGDNLMLHYDNIFLNTLLSGIDITGKYILDFGCGTGRNWSLLQSHNPAKITGCDISAEMLKRLKEKYTGADVHLMKGSRVTFLDNKSTNILISTLVIAHIKNPADTIKEWSRVLKDEADIIITDFHPDLLERGGERTFRNGKNTVKIRNYIYKISFVESLLNNEGFKSEKVIEQKVNEEVKDFYLKKNAMNVYNKFYGIPFIYGLHVRRGYAS